MLKIDLEVLLATHPILMVLRHLERVLDRGQWLHRQLIHQVSPLEVLAQIEPEDRGRMLVLIVLRVVIAEMPTNQVFNLAISYILS